MARKFKNTKHKNPFREDRPKPPFPWMAVTIGVLLTAAVILGSVLLYNRYGSEVRNFTSDTPSDNVYDTRSGITYEYSDLNSYQPAKLGALYGKCGEYKFYAVSEADPRELLFATFIDGEDEYPYGLFCIDGYEFPKPEDFEVSAASIHETEINTVPVSNLTPEAAKSAMEILLKAEAVPYPSGIDSESVMEVYFYSDKYPHLSYVIKFFLTMSGERYLSDSGTGRHVILTEGVLTDYFPEK